MPAINARNGLWELFKAYQAAQKQAQTKDTTTTAQPADTTNSTSGSIVTPVKVVTETAPATQPKVADAPIIEEVTAAPIKTVDDAVDGLQDAVKAAAPEVAEKVGKLVNDLKGLLSGEDTAPAVQKYPSIDAQEDAGKVDAEAYARRAAIDAQAKAKQMDMLDGFASAVFKPMALGNAGYGSQGMSAQRQSVMDDGAGFNARA